MKDIYGYKDVTFISSLDNDVIKSMFYTYQAIQFDMIESQTIPEENITIFQTWKGNIAVKLDDPLLNKIYDKTDLGFHNVEEVNRQKYLNELIKHFENNSYKEETDILLKQTILSEAQKYNLIITENGMNVLTNKQNNKFYLDGETSNYLGKTISSSNEKYTIIQSIDNEMFVALKPSTDKESSYKSLSVFIKKNDHVKYLKNVSSELKENSSVALEEFLQKNAKVQQLEKTIQNVM